MIKQQTRPLIKTRKDGRFEVRYRRKDESQSIDQTRIFDSKEAAANWKSSMIKSYGPILRKGPGNNLSIALRIQSKKLSASSSLFHFIEFWLDYVENNYADKPKSQMGAAKQILKFDIVRCPVNKLSLKHLRVFLRERQNQPSKPAPNTLILDYSLIKKVVEDVNALKGLKIDLSNLNKARKILLDEGLIAPSDVRTVRVEKTQWDHIVANAKKIVKDATLRQKYITYFELYISTCLRCNELPKVTWRDIDFERQTMMVSIGKLKGKGKGKKKRVPITEETVVLLKKLLPKRHNIDDKIFHVKGRTVSKKFKEVAKAAGILGVCLHDLRTEGISRLLSKGLSKDMVALFTGHKTDDVINNVYNQMKAEDVVINLKLRDDVRRFIDTHQQDLSPKSENVNTLYNLHHSVTHEKNSVNPLPFETPYSTYAISYTFD